MLNGMTNTMAMSRTGHLYKNIDSIESKCAELISQIDDHLWVSDSRSLISRNDTENESHKKVDPIFFCCHQSIIDYSTRKVPQKKVNISNLPKLRVAKEFCDKMTKINEPLPDLKSLLKPTSTKCQTLKPALKKQVAFNLTVENEQVGFRNDRNVAVFGCSHYSPTHWHQHKCLASTKDAHAHPESVIDSQPHVHNGVRPPANSTAADIRAFLFGSLKKDGKLPKATKNTIVSVKTKRDLRKKLKRWPEKMKIGEQVRTKRQVFFKIDKPVTEHIENGRIHNGVATNSQKVFNTGKLSDNEHSQIQYKKYLQVEKKEQSSIGESSSQHLVDEIADRKLATQLLKDSMKFCLKNSTKKKISFLLP